MELTREMRRAVRKIAGENWTACPVEVVEGAIPPTRTGESWHYETRTGIRIWHPSAYSKKGWSSMVYISSTRRVEVGKDWLNSA